VIRCATMPPDVGVRNWLGNVRGHVDRVWAPRSTSDLQNVVGSTKGRLLVLGARMSKTDLLVRANSAALDLSGLDAVLELGSGQVRVQGGISVYALSKALFERGQQLPGFTITANPSVGGSVVAPTKGSNHPFTPGANGVSSAVLAATVVRPSGELVELRQGEHDAELALLKDSYSAVGIVAEATLRTIPLVSAAVHETVWPLSRFLEDSELQGHGLEQRAFVFPKLGCAFIRTHQDIERGKPPDAPFESLVTGPHTPYVKLVQGLPRFCKRSLLYAAVRLGASSKPVRKYHVQNLTLYPMDRSYLDFITWSFPIGRCSEVLPRVTEFCRQHPAYPSESLIELFRVFPEVRFLDADERIAFDPVSFDRRESKRWEAFYLDYNRLMVELGASPFLNQTRYLTAADLKQVYGARYDAWRSALLEVDPTRKLGSDYLDRVLGFDARESAATS
jgi:FAD/FMN-containing dehydrogenase